MRETVNINGKFYDAKTGLPVEPEKPKLDTPKKTSKAKKVAVKTPRKITVTEAAKPKPAKPAKAAHRPAPSRTLNRRFVAKPPVKTSKPATPPKPKPKPKPKNVSSSNLRPTISTRPSPVVPRGTKRPAPKATQNPTNTEIPEEKHNTKIISLVVSGIIVFLIVACILAYFFIPTVSFWVASTRAEVNASLPTYTPAGYAIEDRAQSSPGIVTVNYKSPSNDYSISMANSNWDSDGVLENKVKPVSKDYQTLNQKGLTIFVFDNNTMWVNGGILYTISSSSQISNDEILKIVDGM